MTFQTPDKPDKNAVKNPDNAGHPQRDASADMTSSEPQPAEPRTATFESETEGEPPKEAASKERAWVQFAWEAILAIPAIGLLIWGLTSGDLVDGADELGEMLFIGAPYLLLASALGLSLRVGAVNLSVIGAAILSTSFYNRLTFEDSWLALPASLGIGLAAGATCALLIVLLRVPGWAAGLVTLFGVQLIPGLAGYDMFARDIPLHATDPIFSSSGLQWVAVALIVIVSVGGGAVGLTSAFRNAATDMIDAQRSHGPRSTDSLLKLSLALTLSGLIAGAAGFLFSEAETVGNPIGALPVAWNSGLWMQIAMLVLALLLLGGTSLYGRRGGVVGTLLAGFLTFGLYLGVEELRHSTTSGSSSDEFYANLEVALPLILATLGLIVVFVLDRLGRVSTLDGGEPNSTSAPETAATGS